MIGTLYKGLKRDRNPLTKALKKDRTPLKTGIKKARHALTRIGLLEQRPF